jgi:zinc protease
MPYTRLPRPAQPPKAARLLLATPDKQNAFLLVRESVPLNNTDADYPALLMADYLLGGGTSSRLWKRIRESEGLSYGVGTGMAWSRFEPNSAWQGYAIFAPQNRAKVETAFNEEVARALKDGFTAQELTEGVSSFLGYRRLNRAQDAYVAGAIRENQQLGIRFEREAEVDAAIAKLTLAQVNAALRKYIKPGDFASAYAGDFKP